jgi:tetratricopeptide (TPR) repeat protein
MLFHTRTLLRVAFLLIAGCATTSSRSPVAPSADIEATSLDGRPLQRPAIDPQRLARLRMNLILAQGAYDANPSEENTIWLGRRLAYLGRYSEAIEVYTTGLQRYPQSYRLLRHRGHRFITTRQFDAAIADLSRAAELCKNQPDAPEPDGDPTPGVPARSTDKSNIYYHLGLAYYLTGNYENAERWFAKRETLADFNDDMLVSTTHWRVLCLSRLGRHDEVSALLANIMPSLDVRENTTYHNLCMFYQGRVPFESILGSGKLNPGAAYGVATWWMTHGQDGPGRELLIRIVGDVESWAAFGYIAAEADLMREGTLLPAR